MLLKIFPNTLSIENNLFAQSQLKVIVIDHYLINIHLL